MTLPVVPLIAYVVSGQSGEYSDAKTWLVAAFSTRDGAEQHRLEIYRLLGPGYPVAPRFPHDRPEHLVEQDEWGVEAVRASGLDDNCCQVWGKPVEYGIIEVPWDSPHLRAIFPC